jgi:Ca2+-binding RTX toxin-like protein
MAIINGTSGNDYRLGTAFNDQMNGFQGFDTLDGSGQNDRIYGNEQGDILFGGSGLDALYGGQGNDSLDGSTENDVLYGDNDNDTLRGGNGTDTLFGGSGADLFFPSSDSLGDYNSSEDTIGVGGFSALNASSSTSDLFTTSTFEDTPYFIEFKQQGKDLLIGDSLSEGYTTLMGLGDAINDPLPLLSSIDFSYGLLFGNPPGYSEPETASELPDPLTGLREDEMNLIRAIEQLEAGGSLYDLGFQGPGLETLKPEDLQGALSEIQ